jgi:hypothetical protein
MKQKVKLSTYSIIISWVTIILLILLAVYGKQYATHSWPYQAGIAIAAIIVMGLFYMPMSISADSSAVKIHRILKTKTIKIDEIKSIMIYPLPNGQLRVCGSAGFLGYWGWFKDPKLGDYFAFHGKTSDCFLVTLKSGRRYILGCENHTKMVSFIYKQIQ